MLQRILIAALLATLAVASPTPAVQGQAPPTPVTYATVSGFGGDEVTQDKSYFWGLGDGNVTVTGSVSEQVIVEVSGGTTGASFDLRFAAAPGGDLVLGQYDDAQRVRGTTHPGLDVSGNGRRCRDIAGRFTVKEIAPDLSRLWIVFEQRCDDDGVSSTSFGEIKVNMPAGESGLEIAPTSIPWPALAGRSRSTVPVRLVNTGASAIVVESAAISGAEAFSITGNDCGDLAPGASCRFLVAFAPIVAGDYDGMLTVSDTSTAGSHAVPLTGSAFTAPVKGRITTDKVLYGYGAMAQVTATISGTYADPTVSIYTRLRNAPRVLVSTQGVDANGRVTVPVPEPVKETTRFILAWSDGTQSGGDSVERRVRPVVVRIDHPSRDYEFGDRALLTVSLENAPHQRVSVYRRIGKDAPVLIARPTVGASGTAVVPVRVRTNATFIVEWQDDDGVVAATWSKAMTVSAGVRLTPTGYARKAGGYHLYRPGSRIFVRGAVSPNKAGECLDFTVELYDRYWRRLGRTGCVKLSSRSRAAAYLTYAPALLGRRLRFQAAYSTDRLNRRNESPWVYTRYAR